jgi:O-antigen/teichoic acid export membrane protein
VAGQLASCAVSAVALGEQPWTLPSARWLAVARRHAPTAAFAGVTDGIRGISENDLIAASLGVSAVGFYTHARLYYGMLMAGTNAASYNIWPTSLAEARNETREFAITYSLWAPIHILLMIFGAGFVCFGDELISILTNDRLTPAAQLVPWFVVLLLVHLSGRAQNAIVYAHGAGATTTQSRTILAIVVLILFPFVIGNVAGIGFNLGLVGIIGLMLLEAVLFRIYLRWKAVKFGRQPAFQDGLAFCGIAVIVVMWWINFMHDLTWLQRSVMFCGLTVATAVLERRRFARLLSLIQKSK